MGALRYKAFGLSIVSDFLFDVLEEVPGDGPADVSVHRATGITRAERPVADPYFDITPDRQYLHWLAVGTFVIVSPREVLIEPHHGVSDHLVSQAFLGIVMSLILERRDVLCLHAGAVEIAGRAAIFLGDKGAGKSTTCATLLARGHAPLTDDLVAVDGAGEGEDLPLVRPGFSSMKLWPDSIAALDLTDDPRDRKVHPDVTKLQKRLSEPVGDISVPIGGLFVLSRVGPGDQPRTELLAPHLALQNVLRFTFMARYGETRLGRDHLAHHMARCSGIVSRVPVHRLHVPDDLSRLGDLARIIETQFT